MRRLSLLLIAAGVLAGCGARPGAGGPGPAGYVYVIDGHGARGAAALHAVNAAAGRSVRSLDRGAPDAAVAPDGRTLYLWSGRKLEVWDTTAWTRTREIPVAVHAWVKLLPQGSVLALSPDGRYLHGVVYHPDMDRSPGGMGRLGIQTVDLQAGRAVGVVEVPPCFGWLLAARDRVYHLCGGGPLQVVDPAAGRVVQSASVGPVTYRHGVAYGGGGGPYAGFAGMALLPGGTQLALVDRRGQVQVLDAATLAPRATASLNLGERVIPHGRAVASPDGRRLYVPVGAATTCPGGCFEEKDHFADEVRVYDTATWAQAAAWPQPEPFLTLAAAPDGRTLYIVSPATRTGRRLDAATGQEQSRFPVPGANPAWLVL